MTLFPARRWARITPLTALCLIAVSLAPAAAIAKPRVSIAVDEVEAGETLTVKGRGFRARQRVTISLLRESSRSAVTRVKVRANRRGRFSRRVRIAGSASEGEYTVRACQRRCRVKAQTRVTVLEAAQGDGTTGRTLTAAEFTNLIRGKGFRNDASVGGRDPGTGAGARTFIVYCANGRFYFEEKTIVFGAGESTTTAQGTWTVLDTRSAEGGGTTARIRFTSDTGQTTVGEQPFSADEIAQVRNQPVVPPEEQARLCG